ncbi:CcdC protein domain-containing protein [Bacillus sp. FJAT-53711]|uniref:CcdC protein domain-containing protein n=1 Tax=Bacillus yunxiaonensis TaxID=3127665 RepID=UPI00301386F4
MYATKNRSFIIVFIIVFIIRFLLRGYLKWLSTDTEVALFVTAALGYILPWKIVSFFNFWRIYKNRIYTNKEGGRNVS